MQDARKISPKSCNIEKRRRLRSCARNGMICPLSLDSPKPTRRYYRSGQILVDSAIDRYAFACKSLFGTNAGFFWSWPVFFGSPYFLESLAVQILDQD
jgi:hypothetical protein